MKLKLLVLSLLVISLILFISTLGFLYAKQSNTSWNWYDLNDDTLTRNEKMRAAYRLYLHIDIDEQHDIRLELADEIKSNQWNTFTDDELSLAFDTWWIDRMKQIDQRYGRRYGMMSNNTYHCANTTYQTATFAWYYIHASIEDQQRMDLAWIHAIHDIDVDNVSTTEIEDSIDDFWDSWTP